MSKIVGQGVIGEENARVVNGQPKRGYEIRDPENSDAWIFSTLSVRRTIP